jgi:hypothetical protein
MSLRRSILEHFVAPAGSVPPRASGGRRGSYGSSRSEAVAPPVARDAASSAPMMPRDAEARRRIAAPSAVGLLCPPADAESLGAGLGLALVARHRAPVVVVCAWTAETPEGSGWCAPARPATRRLVANLVRRGHDARAAGRLAIVRLPADAAEAAVQARRVSAAAGAAPVVLALGGPRVPLFDECLAEQDLVVVATASGTDPALARLALAGLDGATERACVCEVPPARSGRSLAAAGVTLLPSARRAHAVLVAALS